MLASRSLANGIFCIVWELGLPKAHVFTCAYTKNRRILFTASVRDFGYAQVGGLL